MSYRCLDELNLFRIKDGARNLVSTDVFRLERMTVLITIMKVGQHDVSAQMELLDQSLVEEADL